MRDLQGSVIILLIAVVAFSGCVSNGQRPESGAGKGRAEVFGRLRVNQPMNYISPLALIAQPSQEASAKGSKSRKGSQKTLTFEALLKSVEDKFPLILAAMETVEIAKGELLAAEGGFDLRLKSQGEINGRGFYQNEIGRVRLEQPLSAFGATIFGGYKIGSGDFPTWEGDLKTKEGGEYSLGVSLPLLAGRSIDKRRLALWQARISQDQAQPIVLQKRLEVTRKAASAYWSWVAAGQKLAIAQRLLALASNRQEAVELAVKEGELPRIARIENRRLVVERESIEVRSQRLLQQTAIALSLYWRSKKGMPQIPDSSSLPNELPAPSDPQKLIRSGDVEIALSRRPELIMLQLKVKAMKLKIRQAKNQLLPRLDIAASGSQDTGRVVTNPDDKGPFEAGVFLQLELPVQRRAARGRVKALSAQAQQLEQVYQLAQDRVVADVKDVDSELRQTWLRLAQASENVKLAGEIEEVERLQLREGESDLLRVNLREQQTAAAASMLIDVITNHFRALANYRASLGLPYDEVKTGKR